MSKLVLEVKNLTKSFGEFTAVDNVSFAIPKGKIVGLLGPNGAGKSTTIHMLLGVTEPTSGKISYFNEDLKKNRKQILSRINYTSAYTHLQGRNTVRENFLVYGDLYNVAHTAKKIEELSTYFEISQLLDKPFWDLSAGQKTRSILVKSLLNDPEVLLMDEPTASLDPDIADKTLSFIENLRREKNISILFTSHKMEEVARICDEVIFLNQGKIVAQDTPLGLTKKITKAGLRIVFKGDKEVLSKLLEEFLVTHEYEGKNIVKISLDETLIPKIIFKISHADIWITDIEVQKPTLEDFFLQIARTPASNV